MLEQVITLSPTVVRTERGLVVAGTRITLYQIMDYLKDGWPTTLIRHWLNLSENQLADVLTYIAEHQKEVEEEYCYVLQRSEENRAYWEERNRERLAAIASLPPNPGQEAIYTKLQARKKELGLA